MWLPACQAAGVTATMYDLRHTYASLAIHEGRSVVWVAAMMGHSSATTSLRHYAHLIDDMRLAPMTAMRDAVYQARRELEAAGLHPRCTRNPPRRLRQYQEREPWTFQRLLEAGAAGFEPATISLEGCCSVP